MAARTRVTSQSISSHSPRTSMPRKWSDGLERHQGTPRIAGQVRQFRVALGNHDLEPSVDPAEPDRRDRGAAVGSIRRQNCRGGSLQERTYSFDQRSVISTSVVWHGVPGRCRGRANNHTHRWPTRARVGGSIRVRACPRSSTTRPQAEPAGEVRDHLVATAACFPSGARGTYPQGVHRTRAVSDPARFRLVRCGDGASCVAAVRTIWSASGLWAESIRP